MIRHRRDVNEDIGERTDDVTIVDSEWTLDEIKADPSTVDNQDSRFICSGLVDYPSGECLGHKIRIYALVCAERNASHAPCLWRAAKYIFDVEVVADVGDVVRDRNTMPCVEVGGGLRSSGMVLQRQTIPVEIPPRISEICTGVAGVRVVGIIAAYCEMDGVWHR